MQVRVSVVTVACAYPSRILYSLLNNIHTINKLVYRASVKLQMYSRIHPYVYILYTYVFYVRTYVYLLTYLLKNYAHTHLLGRCIRYYVQRPWNRTCTSV